jgi:hypothetical protein
VSTVAVPLTQGYVAIVDAADAGRVLAYKWHAQANGRTVYAVRRVRRADGKQTALLLHTFLTGYERTDHRNGNGLDNRRINLREATAGENNQNRRQRSDNTSGFKGVHWDKRSSKWRAQVNANGKAHRLGHYLTAAEAARAYDAAARELHGEFATVNFPQPGERAA